MTAQTTVVPSAAVAADARPTAPWAASIGDTLLLRVNPVAGRRLGAPGLLDAVRALSGAQARKRALAEPACAELYELSAKLDGKGRHQALALKRAIYNDREPGAAGLGQWPVAVSAWLVAQGQAHRAGSVIRGSHPDFLAAERATLADAIGDESFQRGLVLIAPQVFDAVGRYRRGGVNLPARERKSERGILQYLSRAMVRTSPLSWFTAIGFAVWSGRGATLDAPDIDTDGARSFVTVDRMLFAATVTGLVETDTAAGAPHQMLTRNSTLRTVGAGVRFARRVGTEVHLVETGLTPQVVALLELTGLGPLPADVLATEVARRLGITGDVGAQVIAAATAAQILIAGPVIDEQAADPVPLARALLGADHPAEPLLAALAREIAEVSRGPVAARQAALDRLDRVQDKINEQTVRPARLHLNEDVLLPTATVTDRGYQAALHDLAGVAELASVFEPNHVLRCLLGSVFVARYGAGASINLLDCGESLAHEVVARARQLTPGAGADREAPEGEVARLLAVRDRARAAVTASLIARPDDEEIWHPAGMFAQLAESLPDRLRNRPASYGMLVQPVNGRLVINGCYGGHNLLGMRFLGPAAEMGRDGASSSLDSALRVPIEQRAAARVERLFGAPGVRLLEDHGLHGSNVNHRIRLLDQVIDPQRWLGVRLTHDPASDDLSLVEPDGAPVRVLYLGMRWIETLPPPLRIAMWLSDTGQIPLDPIGWARRVSTAARYPRLVAGAVVVARRRWYPGADFPDHVASDEAGYLLAVTKWRAAHGVPEEVVVKTAPESQKDVDPSAALAWYQRERRRGKPQYLDLASALMVRVLPRLLERRGSGFIEEALPGVRDGQHAIEWVIEFDRPAGGHFQATRA